MASLNKVMIIGNIGKDPEVRYTPDGAAIANLSLATTSSWKDKNTGEKKEETEWHRVVFYNRLAEIVGEYAKKGRPLYVEGRLKTRKWTDKEGVERYTTDIVADQMQLLGSREGMGDSGGRGGDDGSGGGAPSYSSNRPSNNMGGNSGGNSGGNGGGNGGGYSSAPPARRAPPANNPVMDDDDIPF